MIEKYKISWNPPFLSHTFSFSLARLPPTSPIRNSILSRGPAPLSVVAETSQ